MQPPSPKSLRTRATWFLLASLVGGGCDLHTKVWAERAFREGPQMIIEPWLEFSLVYNRGTAFSFIPDLGHTRWVLGVAALVAVVFLLVVALRSDGQRVDVLALGTLAGGALGNGIDRLIRLAPNGGTGVVDFIKMNYPWGGSWPTFNVADMLVAVGVGMLVVRGFPPKVPAAKPSPGA